MNSTITDHKPARPAQAGGPPIAVEVWAEVSAKLGVKRFIDLSPGQLAAYRRKVRQRKEQQSTESKGLGTRDLGQGKGTRDQGLGTKKARQRNLWTKAERDE